jgi:MoaA/NifB/PqqE/SkfB family radical SAM enzyme
MLSLVSGEPTIHPKLFDILAYARKNGYEHLSISSNFRRFSYPAFTVSVLNAGVKYFDLSLNAYDRASQASINPIGDEGVSFDQAIEGLRNLLSISKRLGIDVEITHKIVAFSLNMRHLIEIMEATRVLGVHNYIVQPVRLEDFPSDEAGPISPDKSGIRRRVEALIRHTEKTGVKLKLFGFSEAGLNSGPSIEREVNLITNKFVDSEPRKSGSGSVPIRSRHKRPD